MNNNEPKKDKSIGAVWQKQSAYGTYLSISVEIEGVKHNFTAFQNQYKEKDNQPDYRIMPPRRPEEGMKVTTKYEDQANLHKASKDKYDTKLDEIMKLKEANSMNLTDSDIPF
jgi:uncharacterized protein (DUF736 family)